MFSLQTKKKIQKNREFNLFVVVLVATMLIFKVNVKVTLKIATRPAIKFKKKNSKNKKAHEQKKFAKLFIV